MTMTRGLWGGCVMACGLLLSACQPDVAVPPEGYYSVPQETRVTVCPQHDSVWIPSRAGMFWTRRATLALPGVFTQIPEFHDCQKLLTQNRQEYGPTAAIYADSQVVDLLETARQLENGSDPLKAVAVATIVSDGPYQKLWIEQGLNCLYLYTQNQNPRAFMRTAADGTDCEKRVAVQSDKRLFVSEEPETTPFDKTDFSPSARWDWDDRGNQRFPFIGLPCGSAYCLYGHQGANSSFRHDRPAAVGRKARRVWKIRTWYDEQILGVIPAQGSPIEPSGVFGTVFPHPDLNERTETDYENAASVYLLSAEIKLQDKIPQYYSKFGLEPPAKDSTNKVYLCKGLSSHCIPDTETVPTCPAGTTDFWFAKIVSASGSTTKYRCVIRHLHPNFPIPGNARWWWDPYDEGIWMRCPSGCCQVT